MTISPGSPTATSLSRSSTTRTSTPGVGRPNARVPIERGGFVIEQQAHHLRHSPDLDEGETETLLEQGVQLRLDAGAKTEANCMIPLFGTFRQAEGEGVRLRRDSARLWPVSG